MDLDRTDLVLEFVLLAAGRADEFLERFLGPIHLLKYVYLADLAHAENHGTTFTGARWRFYHFGPYEAEVFKRIEPATNRLGAQERIFTSQYADDRKMWSIQDDEAFDAHERKLPVDVALKVRKYVKTFGRDTSGLLHFVYKTPPMLRAAPNEYLDFSTAFVSVAEPRDEVPYVRAPLSQKQIKKRAERIREGREKLLAKLQQPLSPGLAEPTPAPRYDDVFDEGMSWLDGLAGGELKPMSGELVVDDGVWKSPGRGDRHDE